MNLSSQQYSSLNNCCPSSLRWGLRRKIRAAILLHSCCAPAVLTLPCSYFSSHTVLWPHFLRTPAVPTLLCSHFSLRLPCCCLIFLRTYPCGTLIFLRTYPAVPLFFCALRSTLLRLPCSALIFFFTLTLLRPIFLHTYPAVPLFYVLQQGKYEKNKGTAG